MSHEFLDSVEDILDAMDKAEILVEGFSYSEFEVDFRTNFAVVRALEIIGEATKRLPTSLREQYPDFLLFGWLEKETVNEGNEHLIDPELRGKIPRLLQTGGYFPNGDHGIQPDVTFPNLCRFMTLLHELCHNPEGEFPRM